MAVILKNNEVNNIPKGSVLFEEAQEVTCICLVLKGKIKVFNNGSKFFMSAGNFLGLCGLFLGRQLYGYEAAEDSTIYVFDAKDKTDLQKVFSQNKEYYGLMVHSLNKLITELQSLYNRLCENMDSLYGFLEDFYSSYKNYCKRTGRNCAIIGSLEVMRKYDSGFSINQEKVNYFYQCGKIPAGAKKEYYSSSAEVTFLEIEGQVELITDINTECMELMFNIFELFEGLYSENEDCLFNAVLKLAADINDSDGDNTEIVFFIEDMIKVITSVDNVVKEITGFDLKVNNKKIEEVCEYISKGNAERDMKTETLIKYTKEETEKAENQMSNALEKILGFSGLSPEKVAALKQNIYDFNNLKDKYSTDDNIRALRKQIAEDYYDLYEKVFLRYYKENKSIRLLELFLNYGFIDEKLLTRDQIVELYYLKDDKKNRAYYIYTMKEWLIEIYEGRKEPSKNEFDLEYAEMLRSMKKKGSITDEEEKECLENNEKKLIYEIKNMLKYNNKIVNGEFTTFVPFLYKDQFVHNIERSVVSANKIAEAMNELLSVDYSAFYRESIYFDEKKGIKREYIIEEIFPDLIIMPTYGSNSVMWQEISGKRRNTSGRFLFPAFTNGKIYDMLVKDIGRFRWELCRTIQGTAWNNIKYKSLTSEYLDYIQFYRKNKELSEAKKEKIKLQIQKARNSTREIFTMDYEQWIKNESTGAIRLNKIVREILATYCPFARPIREQLSKQPLFIEAMSRYQREKLKKIKEIKLRYHALEKEKVELTDELLFTLKYYEEM